MVDMNAAFTQGVGVLMDVTGFGEGFVEGSIENNGLAIVPTAKFLAFEAAAGGSVEADADVDVESYEQAMGINMFDTNAALQSSEVTLVSASRAEAFEASLNL